jgi:L-threonylcarbamoyladenylate synthase
VTQVLTVDPLHISAEAIAQAAALIRAGQLVAFPTETVYGLGANAFDSEAVARIFAAKGRPANDPVIVHIARREQLAAITPHVPELAYRLIDAFWPGPLTLVLARGLSIPPNVSAGLPTVAVRMPAHPVALALIAAAGRPIAAPSANLFAHTSPTTAAHVLDSIRSAA